MVEEGSLMEVISWLFLVVIAYYSIIKFFLKVLEEKEKKKKRCRLYTLTSPASTVAPVCGLVVPVDTGLSGCPVICVKRQNKNNFGS